MFHIGEVGSLLHFNANASASQQLAQGGLIGQAGPKFRDFTAVLADQMGIEQVKRGHDRRDLGEGVAHAAQFTGIAQAILQAAQNPGYVSHRAQQITEIGQITGLGHELADECLAATDLSQIKSRRRQPTFEQTGSRGCGGMVNGAQQGSLARSADGFEDFQVPQGCRVEQEGAGAAVLLKGAQVLRLRAQVFRGVVNESTGGTQCRMVLGQSESLQIQNPKGIHDRPGTARGVEMVAGKFRDNAIAAEVLEVVHHMVVVRGGLPASQLPLRQHQFGRVQGCQDGKQVLGLGIRGYPELAGRKVDPGGMQTGLSQFECAEVVVARGRELIGRQSGSRGENTSDLSADELARLRRLLLIADGHLAAGREELGDIVVGRMKGDAGHRMLLPLGQGDSEQTCPDHCILEKHLVEIPQPKEQQRVGREAPFDLEVLLQHRREFF